MRLVLIAKKTPLEELVDRFGSRAQAEFYVQHAGLSFEVYEAAHEAFTRSRAALEEAMPRGVRVQVVEREFLPSYLFDEKDVIVTLGPDGLVVNVAKYLAGQPIVAFNPDPARIDGVLSRFAIAQARPVLEQTLAGKRAFQSVSMARATLRDGQTLDAFNDLFIGLKGHASVRYRLRAGGREENQSSSGVLVCTGAGSTGWMSSVYAGALAIAGLAGAKGGSRDFAKRTPDSEELPWIVREPFPSRSTGATLVCGVLKPGEALELESHVPEGGVIFSDGIEKDFLAFDSGAVARIGLAPRKATLVT